MSFHIVKADITEFKGDAIVNPTNSALIPGGHGIDDRIHKKAGKGLEEECARVPHPGIGHAVMTDAFDLPCRKIIHTVGPAWQGGNFGEEILLRSCYTESLKIAAENGLETVAFPLISSGARGFPKDRVLTVAEEAIREFLRTNDLDVVLVIADKNSIPVNRETDRKVKAHLRDNRTMPFVCSGIDGTDSGKRTGDKPEILLSSADSFSPEVPLFSADGSVKCLRKEDWIGKLDDPFPVLLYKLIDRKGMTDVDCYKKANVTRQTWHKITTDKNYHPSKKTALSFAIALELSLEETESLLKCVGFALSGSYLFDKIVADMIKDKVYDISAIDKELLKNDQEPLVNYDGYEKKAAL